MPRRPQLVPWRTAGEVTERQSSGDEVVRTTGWVFNNETGSDLTLEQFVATGDDEVGAYLSVFGLQPPDDDRTMVEIGCGIGRMTCAFTREFGTVVACDLDAGFLERCHETVGRFGKIDRLRTVHVADGRTLQVESDSAHLAFSYITLQHCDADDALDLVAEAVRVTVPGGKVAVNLRYRSVSDAVLLPAAAAVRAAFGIPGIGPWMSQRRTFARVGWQANRLHPDQITGPLGPQLIDPELWVHPTSTLRGHDTERRTFEGINPHHYWIVATVR
jgi:ubiquinone/menaquinone biosynthesis C-methylase UbiE